MRTACTMCETEEDPDEFVAVGGNVLCKNCRTCPHGVVHYEDGLADVCYACVRQLFTTEWFWGPAIDDLEACAAYAEAAGLHPANLEGWTWEETDWLRSNTGWFCPPEPADSDALPAFLASR